MKNSFRNSFRYRLINLIQRFDAKRSLFIFCVTVFALACNRHETPTEVDQFTLIQKQIDQKEYASAEMALTKILEQDPHNERARVTLASVSISKAGLTLKSFLALKTLAQAPATHSKSILELKGIPRSKIPESSSLGKAIDLLDQFLDASAQVEDISSKFEQIPVVSDEEAQLLKTAIQELDKIAQPQPGHAIYRGLVKIYLFKYHWKNGYFFPRVEFKLCNLRLIEVANRMDNLQKNLVSLLRDLSQGFPKEKTNFESRISEWNWKFRNALLWIRSQKIANVSLKEINDRLASENSIEGIKCDF
jgi:hypothetical protein